VTASVIGYVGASVAGPVTASTIGYVGASVTNWPANQQTTLASTTVTQPVSGNVTASVIGQVGASVTNWPATQPVSGYLGASIAGGYVAASVANFPGTQPISIASYTVTLPVNIASTSIQIGASISNIPAGQSVIGYVGASVAGGTLTASTIGYVGASVAGPITASVIGYVGASITNTPSVNSFNVGGSITSLAGAATTGGASPYQFISGASFNNVNVKNAAGQIYTIAAFNQNAAQRYLRFYDKGSQPSPGVDTPVHTLILPGNTQGAGAILPTPVGLTFAAGIGFAITGGSVGASDTTVTALGDVALNLGFK
jgi:hypothetical protein